MRWDDDELGQLKAIEGNNFEVVKMGAIIANKKSSLVQEGFLKNKDLR